jgi:hypothetical protein
LKACQYWTDLAHGDFELRFIRDKQQREVDFLVIRDGEPWLLVECKSAETAPSPALLYFQNILRVGRAFQLVTRPHYDRLYAKTGVRVLHYERFFAGLV